jgi:peptidoglycan/LPS O-acetylase OafA/YrhL
MAGAVGRQSVRIPALDFTKGALVLFMVLYHWLNYFIGTEGEFYKYLRFLTPSFIFITGFLISNVHLRKYERGDPQLPKRLVQRGVKLLGLFLVLNLIVGLVFSESYSGKILFAPLSIPNVVSVYVTGNVLVTGQGKTAVFYILVPISYLLLVSAGLLTTYRSARNVFHVVGGMFLLCVLGLKSAGLQSANLELLTIGLVGVICGYVSLEKINEIVKRPYIVIVGYLTYTAAITVWDVTYPVQIVGVCLTLLLIYLLGCSQGGSEGMRAKIILLGKYSLFGYIAQIVVLQGLFRGLRHVDLGAGGLGLSFLGAVVLTMVAVMLVDRGRGKLHAVDRLYKVVFA